MKAGIILTIILSCFFIDAIARDLPDSTLELPQFRNIPWGSSMKEVREKEEAHYLQYFSGFGVTALSFKDKITGIETRIDYTFKEDKLIEGSYIVISGEYYKKDFVELLKFVIKDYGQPEYRSGKNYIEDTVWIKENDYGSFSGPSYYWEFKNGFIGLISKKFKEEITITLLFVNGSSIGKYAENRGVELNEFPFIIIEN